MRVDAGDSPSVTGYHGHGLVGLVHWLPDTCVAACLVLALFVVRAVDVPREAVAPARGDSESAVEKAADSGPASDVPGDGVSDIGPPHTNTTASANERQPQGNEDGGQEQEARQLAALAIVDSFQPFTPKIVDAAPASVELTVPSPPPPRVVEDTPPVIEVTKPPEPKKVEFFKTEARATSVGFVVDCSSSMSGEKFQAVCNELAASILRLKADQKFFVVFFNNEFFPMSGRNAAPTLVPANRVNKEAILRFLGSASANGGTFPEPAICFLAALRPEVIYLLTDGEFTPLTDRAYRLLADSKATVHTIGFESGGRVATLEEIARRTTGTYRSATINSAQSSSLYCAPPPMVRAALSAADATTRGCAAQVALWRELPCFPEVVGLLADADVRDVVHEALRELADPTDLGPADAADVAGATSRWKSWVRIRNASDRNKQILAGLRSPDRNEQRVAASLAASIGLNEPDALIDALRTAPAPIWQDLHRALVRCCPAAGDLGPASPSATAAEVEEAAARWAEWRVADREKEARVAFEKRCKRAKELLRLARAFELTKPDVFERRLDEIIQDFGDTPAAEEAKQLLE
jgi:hypothetical protein